jgi:hypothetical protein
VKSEISNKAGDMRTASIDEAADLLREIAGDRRADESLKSVFRRLRRKLTNWSDNRIRDIWRRDSRIRVRAEEVKQLRALSGTRSMYGAAADNELAELRQRISRLEALLERTDPAFHGPQLDALRSERGKMG